MVYSLELDCQMGQSKALIPSEQYKSIYQGTDGICTESFTLQFSRSQSELGKIIHLCDVMIRLSMTAMMRLAKYHDLWL